jgi:type I restriction enzyme S subunit
LKEIREFTFSLPNQYDQNLISSNLFTFDKKIEFNNKINKNLEETALTLYKRWFVDFEFPNEKGEPYKSSGGEMVDSELGLIPKGWEVKKLDNFIPVLTGKKNANVAKNNGIYITTMVMVVLRNNDSSSHVFFIVFRTIFRILFKFENNLLSRRSGEVS